MSTYTTPGFSVPGASISAPPKKPQSDEERQIIAALLTLYDEARNHRSDWDRVWKKAWEFYVGKQWPLIPSWKADPVENFIHSKVETILPIMTDNRPTIHTLPREAKYQEYAKHLQSLFRYLWDRLGMDDVVLEVTKNTLIFGKGFYYSYWDYETAEIACVSVDPQNIYVDPLAKKVSDARYLIHVDRMSKWDILNMWPDAAGKFQTGAQTVPDPATKSIHPPGDMYTSVHVGQAYADPSIPTGSTVEWVRSGLQGFGTPEDETVQVLQYWIRDPSLTTEPLLDSKGKSVRDSKGNELFVEKRKYPGGRHIVVAGDRIIHDAANPFLHGEFPYVEQDCHRIPGEFWGISAVQHLLPIQRELNKTLGQLIDNRNLMGNNMWSVTSNSGITSGQIVSKPGLVIIRNPGSEVLPIQAPALPNYVPQLLDHAMLAMDRVSGVSDVTEGRKPTGITAGIAIESLQEAGQTRLRALVRNLENAIQRTGQQWVGICQQFYDSARTVRVTDNDTGQYYFETVTPDMIQAQWEIDVVAGSTLPRSREVRQGQAVELFQLGVFDAQALLEWIQHPGADEILARMKQQQQKQMEMMAMMGQMGQAFGGGPPASSSAARTNGGPPPQGQMLQPNSMGGASSMPMGVRANLRSQQR